MINLLFKPLNALDGWLAQLFNPIVNLVFWGVVGGSLAMLAYTLFSDQKRLAETKAQIKHLQKMLMQEDLDIKEYKTLGFANLRLSLILLRYVSVPALVSAIPVLLLALWLSVYQTYEPIPVEAALSVRAASPVEELAPGKASAASVQQISGSDLTFYLGERPIYIWDRSRPLAEAIEKRHWWNSLLGNESGYLLDSAPVDRLEFDLRRKTFLDFGPFWMRTWELPYFLAVMITAIGWKLWFRIE